MSFVSTMAAPFKVNPPAGLLKVMPSNGVLMAKLLVFTRPTVPPKLSASPADGGVPPQLAGVVHLLSVPPPFQVSVPAKTELTLDKHRTATVIMTDQAADILN